MMQNIHHYINGERVNAAGEKAYAVFNPAQAVQTAQVICATPDEIEQAVFAAKQAFSSWSCVTPLKRARVLFQFKALLEKNIDRLAVMLTEEHGKTLDDAKGEVLRAIELVEFSCGTPYLLQGSYSENVGTQVDAYTLRQPLGVCVGVTPFNFPVMISTWMFVPAIACGNTFILKPSEKDPSSTILLAELMQEAGLPAGVLNVLQGDKDTVNDLITHCDVACVSAVGSTPVAEHIYLTAISHGKRAHTFGGAKNHCVVMPDADINAVSSAIVGAAYGAAGERCMAISVAVTVTDQVADSLVEQLKIKIPKLKIANGIDKQCDMGPLVSEAHRDRVNEYVTVGVREGAKLIIDGRAHDAAKLKGFFIGPSLFDCVTADMRIYQEEIFGPVLCIVRVSNFQEAISLINKNIFGNGVSIFTKDGATANFFASAVSVGMVGVNVPIPVPVAYHTFGGWKRSIFGDVHMHGPENVHFYTRVKTVTMNWAGSFNIIEKPPAFHMPSN